MMMRLKAVLLAALLLTAGPLAALRSGDTAEELDAEILSGGPFTLLTSDPAAVPADQLKVLVLMRAATPVDAEILPLLYDVAAAAPRAKIIAVSIDPEAVSKELFAKLPNPNFATAVDNKSKTAKKYLTGAALFPRCFVIDTENRIIWDGEAMDLAEMLQDYYAGRFDADRQVKVSPLLDELLSRMRSGEDRQADYAARKIFKLDPGNSAAIRIRLFMLESTGRYQEAWQMLQERRQALPETAKPYLLLIDFACRRTDFMPQLADVLTGYMTKVPADPATDGSVAYAFLTRRPFDPSALELAGRLIGRGMKTVTAEGREPRMEDAALFSAAALYASRTGALSSALKMQQQATARLAGASQYRRAASLRLEEFYRKCLALGKPAATP
ncbi:MAG: hypothetical protein IJC73_02515 [Lentisphaeria bacterium]|nr:hypothetical protein [Lentisphaeria bacterium]